MTSFTVNHVYLVLQVLLERTQGIWTNPQVPVSLTEENSLKRELKSTASPQLRRVRWEEHKWRLFFSRGRPLCALFVVRCSDTRWPSCVDTAAVRCACRNSGSARALVSALSAAGWRSRPGRPSTWHWRSPRTGSSWSRGLLLPWNWRRYVARTTRD